MSNSFNSNQQGWPQRQSMYGRGQPQLQLEQHEFDFSAIPSLSSTQHRDPRRSQQQMYSDPSYHLSQSQFLPGNSTLSSNGFATRQQQATQSRDVSYETQYPNRSGSGNQLDPSFSVHGVYGSKQHVNPNILNSNPSFLTAPTSDPPEQRTYYSNSHSFNFSSSLSPDSVTSSLAASDIIAAPQLSSSPGPMQESFSHIPTTQQQPYYHSHSSSSPSGSHTKLHTKRQRGLDTQDDVKEEDIGGDANEQKDGGKAKGLSACARCKNLKVRCEGKSDTDPCKRCLNGGHECYVPSRKKRRTPPKREHLLNEIQKQADQIKSLMSQLEATNARPKPFLSSASSFTHSTDTDLHSPVLSPSTSHTSYFSESNVNVSGTNPETNKAVEEWIAKARESLAVFDGYLGIGGGLPKSYLVDEDPEDSGSGPDEDAYWEAEDNEYDFAVADSDGEEKISQNNEENLSVNEQTNGTLRQRSSASSLSTCGTGGVLGQKKKHSGGTDKLATLPSEASPFGLMAGLSLKKKKGKGSSDEEDGNGLGVANANFFSSRPALDPKAVRAVIPKIQPPHILTRGIVTPEEAEKLFNIYFQYMNLSLSLLDPVLYTAQKTCWRSPFLFTVICAIASRHYLEKPDLYPQVMHYAQLAAGTALISGTKSVETCQAYILLSLYPVPARRWEEDRSWLYLGLAIRVATDLNLHYPTTAKPTSEAHAREMLNRTRVWLNCYNLDRSTGSQYGKSPIIKNSDYIACHSGSWWNSSAYNLPHFDIHLSCYNADLRTMSEFMAKIYSDPHHPTGLNRDIDFERLATETDDELVRLGDSWFTTLEQTDMKIPENCFRTGLLKLAYSYARLVSLSFGFQHAFGKNDTDENPFLLRCLRAASDVVNVFVKNIGRPSQRIYLRHGPEAQSVFVTFASSFLVKLLQPRFASYLTMEQRVEIRSLVQSVIDLLGSPEVAIDDRHGPKLYSRFLKGLLATPMARADPQSPGATSTRQRASKHNAEIDVDRPFEIPTTVSNHASPSTEQSLSPPPSQAALSFDQFAPTADGVDPFGSLNTRRGSQDLMGLDFPMPDFFPQQIAFGDEMLDMQSLAGSTWQDISSSDYNWASPYQNNFQGNLTQHQFIPIQ